MTDAIFVTGLQTISPSGVSWGASTPPAGWFSPGPYAGISAATGDGLNMQIATVAGTTNPNIYLDTCQQTLQMWPDGPYVVGSLFNSAPALVGYGKGNSCSGVGFCYLSSTGTYQLGLYTTPYPGYYPNPPVSIICQQAPPVTSLQACCGDGTNVVLAYLCNGVPYVCITAPVELTGSYFGWTSGTYASVTCAGVPPNGQAANTFPNAECVYILGQAITQASSPGAFQLTRFSSTVGSRHVLTPPLTPTTPTSSFASLASTCVFDPITKLYHLIVAGLDSEGNVWMCRGVDGIPYVQVSWWPWVEATGLPGTVGQIALVNMWGYPTISGVPPVCLVATSS